MSNKRKVEVFSAGCPVCEDVIRLVKASACPSCDVTVLDTNDIEVAQRAKALGISKVPSVVIDGVLASCCAGGGSRPIGAESGWPRFGKGVTLADCA